MTFHVGQKVVCVNDTWDHPDWRYIPARPVKGRIYTVRHVCICSRVNGPELSILLNEINNPIRMWRCGYIESNFPAFRFRPVVERKTDISIFTEMLTPTAKQLETVSPETPYAA